MRDELEGLINEKLDGIKPSLEEVYEPIKEEIDQEVAKQNSMIQEQNKPVPEEQPIENNKPKEDVQ